MTVLPTEASSTDAELKSSKPIHRHSPWKRACLIVLGMLMPFVLSLGWIEWQIATIEDETRALGLPVSRDELDNFQTRPDQSDESARQWKELDRRWDVATAQLSREDSKVLQNPWGIPDYSQPWDNLVQFESILSRLRPVLAAYQDQLDQPGQSWDQHSGQPHRGLYRTYICELRVAIHRGESDRAFQAMRSLTGLVNAERGCAEFLSMLSWLAYLEGIRSEVELALPHVTWTDSQLLGIQERLCAINLHEELRFSQAGSVIVDGEHISEEALWVFQRTNRLQLLRYFESAQSLGALPWPQMQSELSKISAPIQARKVAPRWYDYPQKEFIETFVAQDQLVESIAHQALNLILLDAGLAIHRHQLRHGRLPQSWDEIDKDLFMEFPDRTSLLHDPRDGLPLQFIVEKDHVRLTPGTKVTFRYMPEFRIDRIGVRQSRLP